MPICTQCTYPVVYLYTLYQSVNNLRLEQCVGVSYRIHSLQLLIFSSSQPNCLAFADPYVEHDPLTLLLDLILLKREVYRHLLFNRGHEPRHLGKPGTNTTNSVKERISTAAEVGWRLFTPMLGILILLQGTWKLIIQLASMLISIDACGCFS